MNIAAITLIIFFLLLPGITFRRFYYTGEFSKQYFQDTFGQLALRVFVPSALAQGFLAWLMMKYIGGEQDEVYKQVLSAATNLKAIAPSTDQYMAGAYMMFLLWQLLLISVSGLVGYTTQYLVRRYRVDTSVKLFRFQNHWHYLLRGGIRRFERVRPLFSGRDNEVASTCVDVLVATAEGDMLYDGMLADYELKPGNQLDRSVLVGASRRRLSNDGTSSSRSQRFQSILDDLFVIPGDQMNNVNRRYVVNFALHNDHITVHDADGDMPSAAYFNDPV